jgi:MFS family permease
MPFYQARFNAGVVGSSTGIIFSVCKGYLFHCVIYPLKPSEDTIGGVVSPWVAGPITDKLGRRAGMFIGAIGICLGESLPELKQSPQYSKKHFTGSAVISSASDKGQFIAGRFLLGFGVSILTCAAPSYIVEVSPPQWRGRLTGIYNCGWVELFVL